MSDESGIEPRSAASINLNARVTALEVSDADQETRIDALEAASGAAQQIYACPMSAAVLQLVYVSGAGAADLADATDVNKMKNVQFIASKPTSTSCTVQDRGELDGFV